MNFLYVFVGLAFVFGAVLVAGLGYYLHRKHVDRIALDAAKAAVTADVNKVGTAIADAVTPKA